MNGLFNLIEPSQLSLSLSLSPLQDTAVSLATKKDQ
jgi:hypothetical protein